LLEPTNKLAWPPNLIADNAITAISDEATELNYGYGLGLFLAEKICQQCQWSLDISSTAQLFRVKVGLNDVNEDEKNDF